MADEAYWADIEQFLAVSGLQAHGAGASTGGAGSFGEVFDSVPAAFGGRQPMVTTTWSQRPLRALPRSAVRSLASFPTIQAINELHELRKRTGIGLNRPRTSSTKRPAATDRPVNSSGWLVAAVGTAALGPCCC